MLQLYPFRSHRECLRWAPLNGTSYWLKHDENFPFRKSGFIRKRATSFPQPFCSFPASLVLWSRWSQGKSLQICPPCSSTLRQKSVDIRRLILRCVVIRHVRNPFAVFRPPQGADRRVEKGSEGKKKLFFLVSCNSSRLLANTCLTQTQTILFLLEIK